MGSSSGAGAGSGSRYLEPHRVYELLTHLMPQELLDYLDSIPGSSTDHHCNQVKAIANRLDTLLSQPLRSSLREETRRILSWAQLARSHAKNSRFCAPQMVGNSSNFIPDAGETAHQSHPDPLPRTRNGKGRMGSLSARCLRAPGAISQTGGSLPPSSSKQHGGALLPPGPASTSPSILPCTPLTSPPRTSPTSPPSTSPTSLPPPCCRTRRRLRFCQRRVLTHPSEAKSSPPRRVLRSASTRRSSEFWHFRQTDVTVRVLYDEDDHGAPREDIIRGWSDDGLD